jgi:hypothetical protein
LWARQIVATRDLSLLLLPEGVKNELDASGDAQLFINAEHIIADGVFGQTELLHEPCLGNTITNSFGVADHSSRIFGFRSSL